MDMSVVGQKLVALRGNRTQEEVAKAIGTSLLSMRIYESGQRIPRDEIKVRLARYYGKTIEELFFSDFCHKTCP